MVEALCVTQIGQSVNTVGQREWQKSRWETTIGIESHARVRAEFRTGKGDFRRRKADQALRKPSPVSDLDSAEIANREEAQFWDSETPGRTGATGIAVGQQIEQASGRKHGSRRCLVLRSDLDFRFGTPTRAPSPADGSTATNEILVSTQFHSERPRLHARLCNHSDRDRQLDQQPTTDHQARKRPSRTRVVQYHWAESLATILI